MSAASSGDSALAPAPAPAYVPPPPAARPPPRLAAPYSLGEDVLSLPCGALKPLLDCFRTGETRELQAVSVDARAHVADHAWADTETPIADVALWRVCFPRARGARLSSKWTWREADFQTLRGVVWLKMSRCHLAAGATGENCFRHLAGPLHALDLSYCHQGTLFEAAALAQLTDVQVIYLTHGNVMGWASATDASVARLTNVRELTLKDCRGITNAALAGLAHLTSRVEITDSALQGRTALTKLNVGGCDKLTNAAIANLRGLTELNVSKCSRITDAAFEHLGSLTTLDISNCAQLTDAALAPLGALRVFRMSSCRHVTPAAIARLATQLVELDVAACGQMDDSTVSGLTGLQKLRIALCDQLTDAAIRRLTALTELDISACRKITSAAFKRLGGLRVLVMSNCDQPTLGSAAFTHLTRLQELQMEHCTQVTLTDAAFAACGRSLRVLHMSSCTQITGAVFNHLGGLTTLGMSDCIQPSIGDAALAKAGPLETLLMLGCTQATLTDSCLVPFRRTLRNLNISECKQLTDAVLFGFAGLLTFSGGGSGVSRAPQQLVTAQRLWRS